MKNKWQDISVRDYLVIKDILGLHTSEDEKVLKIAALCSDMPYDDFIQLPLSKTEELVRNVDFMYTDIPKEKVKKKYILGGKSYTLLENSDDMTVAQYIDFDAMRGDGFDRHIVDLLAIFLVPKGHLYNDGYDKEEVKEDILNLGIVEALSIADFFIRRQLKSLKRLIQYLRFQVTFLRMTASKEERERMKALELEMNLVLDELGSMYGSLLLRR